MTLGPARLAPGPWAPRPTDLSEARDRRSVLSWSEPLFCHSPGAGPMATASLSSPHREVGLSLPPHGVVSGLNRKGT